MVKKDGRLVAQENEIKVLRALHRFGWLRTRDLASLCWQRWALKPGGPPNLKPIAASASGIRMAQRTLRRLRAARFVIVGKGADGSVIYALSSGGARKLHDNGVLASSGKDLVRAFSSAHYRHRCIANEVAIAAIVQGFRASTEREIAQGRWLGGDAGIAGKRPDVLLRGSNRLYFVEVERSRKNAKDYQALLVWLRTVLRDSIRSDGSRLLESGQTWGRVIFICTSAFEVKLRKDLEAVGWNTQQIEKLICFNSELYYFMDTLFS